MQKLIRKCIGFTITEILIALFLSSFVMIIITQLFLSLKQINQYQYGIARIQENMQVASHLLGNWVRSAGDYGCNRMDAHRRLNVIGNIDTKHLGINRASAIEFVDISELVDNPFFSKYAFSRCKKNSDLLWLKRVTNFYPLADYTQEKEPVISVVGNPNYKKGDILFLMDCQSIDVIQVMEDITSKRPTVINTNIESDIAGLKLSKVYSPSAEIGKFESVILYVADTLRKNQSGDPIYALFSTDLNGNTLELIEGVDDMRVMFYCQETEFYRKRDCYPSVYCPKDCSVEFVKIHLSFNSVENVFSSPMRHNNSELNISFKDKKLHKEWSGEWSVRSMAH